MSAPAGRTARGGNASGSFFDFGDGCLVLALHGAGQQVDDAAVEILESAAALAAQSYEALVVGSDGDHFGVGADLRSLLHLAAAEDWAGIDARVRRFQAALEGLRSAPVPVVAAPFHYALGGAAEIALAADARQALDEVYLGLVEPSVGLVPAGGGCLAMLERWSEGLDDVPGADAAPFLAGAVEGIAFSRVAGGAGDARRMRFLGAADGVTTHRERLLEHARHRALGLARSGYRPPPARSFRAAGRGVAERIGAGLEEHAAAGRLDPYDAEIGRRVAEVMCGGDAAAGSVLGRQAFLDLEREAFLSLCGDHRTRGRLSEVVGSSAAEEKNAGRGRRG